METGSAATLDLGQDLPSLGEDISSPETFFF